MALVLLIVIGVIFYLCLVIKPDEIKNDRPVSPIKRKAITNSKSPFSKDDPLFAEYQKIISQSVNKHN